MANPRYNQQVTNRRGAMGGGMMKKPMMKKGGDVKKIEKAFKPKTNLKKVDAKKNPGLYANIHAKRKRGGKMRKKGAKGAPTAANFKRAAQTARKR